MSAFASSGSGDWHVAATWGGADYPGSTGARTDTYTIANGHTVTMTVATEAGIIGAGTVNGGATGGKLVINCIRTKVMGTCTLAYNAAVSGELNQADGSTFLTTGITTINGRFVTGNNCTHKGSGTVSTNGWYNVGVNSYVSIGNNFTFDGTVGQEGFVFVYGGRTRQLTIGTGMQIKNQYRSSATYPAQLTFYLLGQYKPDYTIGDITIGAGVGAYGIEFYGGIINTGTYNIGATCGTTACLYAAGGVSVGNITCNITAGALYAISLTTASIDDGTWNVSSTTGTLFFSDVAISFFRGGTWTVSTTGNTNGARSTLTNITGGTWNITNTVAAGNCLSLYGVNENATFNLSGAVNGISLQYRASLNNCIVNISGCTNAIRFYGAIATQIKNSVITINNTNTNGFIFLDSVVNPTNIEIKHGVNGNYIVNEATNKFVLTNIGSLIEPLVYVTSRASKTFDIYYDMSPYNVSDFITTGVVSYIANVGATTITGAGTLETPALRLFDVTDYGIYTFVKTGADGSETHEYAVSTDGGVTFGAWVAIASGDNIAATPVGSYLDVIKFKITNASGTLICASLLISGNVYTEINGGQLYY